MMMITATRTVRRRARRTGFRGGLGDDSGGCILGSVGEIRLTGDSVVAAGGEVQANCFPPSEPAQTAGERATFAAFGRVGRRHRNESHRKAGLEEANDQVGFNFGMVGGEAESFPGGEVDEAEAALRIGKRRSAIRAEAIAHPAVYEPANK